MPNCGRRSQADRRPEVFRNPSTSSVCFLFGLHRLLSAPPEITHPKGPAANLPQRSVATEISPGPRRIRDPPMRTVKVWFKKPEIRSPIGAGFAGPGPIRGAKLKRTMAVSDAHLQESGMLK
jgi:hypothetical protein